MPKESQELTVEWLRDQLIGLLGQAAAGEQPDHAACAKYADLLYKMLPKKEGSSRVSDEALVAARKAVLDGLRS